MFGINNKVMTKNEKLVNLLLVTSVFLTDKTGC